VKYVLDTNVVSALMRGAAGDLERLRREAKQDVSIPQPVRAELAYGIERLPRSGRRDRLRARYQLICDEIPHALWTDEVSRRFGIIKAALERRGERIEDFDAAIAAHALALSAVLVSANADHMQRIEGLETEDWEQPA